MHPTTKQRLTALLCDAATTPAVSPQHDPPPRPQQCTIGPPKKPGLVPFPHALLDLVSDTLSNPFALPFGSLGLAVDLVPPNNLPTSFRPPPPPPPAPPTAPCSPRYSPHLQLSPYPSPYHPSPSHAVTQPKRLSPPRPTRKNPEVVTPEGRGPEVSSYSISVYGADTTDTYGDLQHMGPLCRTPTRNTELRQQVTDVEEDRPVRQDDEPSALGEREVTGHGSDDESLGVGDLENNVDNVDKVEKVEKVEVGDAAETTSNAVGDGVAGREVPSEGGDAESSGTALRNTALHPVVEDEGGDGGGDGGLLVLVAGGDTNDRASQCSGTADSTHHNDLSGAPTTAVAPLVGSHRPEVCIRSKETLVINPPNWAPPSPYPTSTHRLTPDESPPAQLPRGATRAIRRDGPEWAELAECKELLNQLTNAIDRKERRQRQKRRESGRRV